MVKEIIWSEQAIEDRKNIADYWTQRNLSNAYSIKLDLLFEEAVSLISEYPFIGKALDIRDARAKRVFDYYILYRIAENKIYIVTIWDTRQKPARLRKRLK